MMTKTEFTSKIVDLLKGLDAHIEGDALILQFDNILEQIDVDALVKAGVSIDAEFSEDVVQYLNEQGTDFENFC